MQLLRASFSTRQASSSKFDLRRAARNTSISPKHGHCLLFRDFGFTLMSPAFRPIIKLLKLLARQHPPPKIDLTMALEGLNPAFHYLLVLGLRDPEPSPKTISSEEPDQYSLFAPVTPVLLDWRMGAPTDAAMDDARQMMETEAMEEAGPMKPQFQPLSAHEMGGGRIQFRKVFVPPHRYTPLKKHWMEIYTPIVEHMKIDVRMNLKV